MLYFVSNGPTINKQYFSNSLLRLIIEFIKLAESNNAPNIHNLVQALSDKAKNSWLNIVEKLVASLEKGALGEESLEKMKSKYLAPLRNAKNILKNRETQQDLPEGAIDQLRQIFKDMNEVIGARAFEDSNIHREAVHHLLTKSSTETLVKAFRKKFENDSCAVRVLSQIDNLETIFSGKQVVTVDGNGVIDENRSERLETIIVLVDCIKITPEELSRLNSNDRFNAQLNDSELNDPQVKAKKLKIVPINYGPSFGGSGSVADVIRRQGSLLKSISENLVTSDVLEELKKDLVPVDKSTRGTPVLQALIEIDCDYEKPKGIFKNTLSLESRGIVFYQAQMKEKLESLKPGETLKIKIKNCPPEYQAELKLEVEELNRYGQLDANVYKQGESENSQIKLKENVQISLEFEDTFDEANFDKVAHFEIGDSYEGIRTVLNKVTIRAC